MQLEVLKLGGVPRLRDTRNRLVSTIARSSIMCNFPLATLSLFVGQVSGGALAVGLNPIALQASRFTCCLAGYGSLRKFTP
jgi:hypothetical protein